MIAHVIAPGAVGGAESVVRILAAGRHERQGQTHVIALVNGSDPPAWVENMRRLGVPTHEVATGRRQYLEEARATAKVLTELRTAVVHSHVYHADFVAYLAGRRAQVPTVATYHGHVGGDLRNRIYEWTDRRLLTRFDAVACVSHRNRDRLRRVGGRPERLYYVPNGIVPVAPGTRDGARSALGLQSTGPVLGWVGRLSHEKGLDLLIAALAVLDRRDAMLVVIGDGPERERLTMMAARSGVAVRFVGERDQAATVLPAFDVVVSSSRTEGLPMVLLEAMSAGTPVVAFGVGGIPQLLADDTGWLVPPGEVRQLAHTLGHVLTNPSEAARRAERARAVVVEEYGVDRWLDRLEGVYDTVAHS